MNLRLAVGQCFGVFMLSFERALVASLAIFVNSILALGVRVGGAGSFLGGDDCLLMEIGLALVLIFLVSLDGA